jgi:two-component system KDP operon response regulator KdpE
MRPVTVLVVDDEPQIRRVVRRAVEATAARVIEAPTGRDAIDAAAAERPDLIVLDLGLPDVTGLEVCREVRQWSTAPILVLSARHSETEKVGLLDAGADDYMTKPFGTAELIARIRALMRRAASPNGESRVRIGGIDMDLAGRTISLDGAEVHLTPIEWELLRALITQPGRTLTHQQLFRAAWPGRAHGDAQQYLRVHVAHLRRKLEADPVTPRYIVTEPGVGYRFGLTP